VLVRGLGRKDAWSKKPKAIRFERKDQQPRRGPGGGKDAGREDLLGTGKKGFEGQLPLWLTTRDGEEMIAIKVSFRGGGGKGRVVGTKVS